MIRNHPNQTGRRVVATALRLMVIGVGAALAGCETVEDQTAAIRSDYRQRHPIAIVEKDRTLHVFVGSARNGLTADQRTDVVGFARSWRDEGTGRFVIDQPFGVRNARAAAAALGEIRSILRASGVPAEAIRVQSYRAPRDALAVIRINYPQTAAHVASCGQWPDDLGPSNDPKHFENFEYWNFGCTTRRNIAAMVENPADLVQPRAEGPVYRGRRTIALEKYRKGESPATTYPDASKGAISDLGK